MAKNLADIGFNLVSGANNHSLDKGVQGVQNTLTIWGHQSDRTLFTGIFDSAEEREKIPLVEIKGITFSFLAYTYGTNGVQADAPYRVNYLNETQIRQDVERAKAQSD